jgi:UDP-GlcNAc:undecaprenyl-phosphate GlcNAc-1-phosphate transferase
MLRYGLLGMLAMGVAFLVTPWVRLVALRLGAMDEPVGHHNHQGAVPCLGGLVVLIACVGTVGLVSLVDGVLCSQCIVPIKDWPWLLAGAVVVVVTGVIDDFWDLTPGRKIALLSPASLIVSLSGFGITTLTDPFTDSSIPLGWLTIPLTLLWVMGITNAFNLIDGLDGLAAGVALIVSLTVWAIAIVTGRADVAPLAAVLAGAIAGFLPYNTAPAAIFLGDSGSLLLGYLLSILTIQAARPESRGVILLAPLLVLGLPVLDTLLAVTRRLRRATQEMPAEPHGKRHHFFVRALAAIFRPDREHIHHRLLARGFTPWWAVLMLYSVCIGLGLAAFLVIHTSGIT